MLNWVIDASLRCRLVVVLAAVGCAAAGAFALAGLDIDAFPDTAPVQVQANTTAAAPAPEEIETQITFPVEQVLSGRPKLKSLSSVSKFGPSQAVVAFEDGVDGRCARRLVDGRLDTVSRPSGVPRPKLGPVSTGLGEVFQYTVSLKGWDYESTSVGKDRSRPSLHPRAS